MFVFGIQLFVFIFVCGVVVVVCVWGCMAVCVLGGFLSEISLFNSGHYTHADNEKK